MKPHVLIILCFAFPFNGEVFASAEVEVSRGVYNFMAFLYYPDESIVDTRGLRFLRSAVLIRPEWLITSAVGLSTDDGKTNGFPRNTLLARAGTITIDANLTLNEEDDEQEREIIEIIRPSNHSGTKWWHTDISLMKTLLPFNMTAKVGLATISFKQDYEEKSCIILVYATKYGNMTEDKILMPLSVDLLPASMTTCGHYYVENTMICSSDSDENKNAIYDPNYCQGNGGGPLICDGKVIGLQTYIEDNCKQPHLYQLLSAWKDFITCGKSDKCQVEQCANVCTVTSKDVTTTQSTSTTSKFTYLTTARTAGNKEIITTTTAIIKVQDEESEVRITPTLTSTTSITSTQILTKETETESSSTVTANTTESTLTTEKIIEEQPLDTTPWPNEKKYKNERKKLDENDDDIERKINMEAQQQEKDIEIKKTHSAAQMNMCIFQTFFFRFSVMTYFIYY